jgi:hypothetical protein
MSMRRNIFATAADLLPGLARFDEACPIHYFETGLFDSQVQRGFDRGAVLPHLGFAPSGDANHEPRFLVVTQDTNLVVREIPQRVGGVKFAVDQLHNPASTVFQPGGLYETDVLISGQIASTGTTADAIEIQRLMVQTVTKGFRRVQSYWLGPEAFAMLHSGARLTPAVQTPRLYDLRMPDAG